MLVLADHDGDDRSGDLVGALKDFVLAREDATSAEDFAAKFDDIMGRLLGELIDEQERRGQ
jgi:hypothetical protein